MISWLRRLFHRSSADPAWKPTGYTVKYSGFNQRQLARARERAAICEEQRRLLAAKRSQPDPKPRRRRKAAIVEMQRPA